MQNITKQTEKTNPFLWFIFAIVIPVIVATILTILILAMAGVNVVDWAKKTSSNIPVISSFVKTDEEKTIEQVEEKSETALAQKDNEIDQLETGINNLEAKIDQLEQEIVKLENELASETQLAEAHEQIADNEQENIKRMSASFRKMKSNQAALIFQDLEDEIAIAILKELSNDVRGGIFEAMDPKRAAQLTKLFIDE